MKNLQKLLLVLVIFITQVTVLNAMNLFQEETEPVKIVSVVVAGATSILLSALLEAINHVIARTFEFKVWWISIARPAIWTFIVYIVLALLDIFVPFLDALVQAAFNVQTDASDTAALVVIAYALFPTVKALFKVNKAKEEQGNMTTAQKIAKYKSKPKF